MSDTVYLKIPQIVEVYEPEVYLKDIAEVHCQNPAVEAKAKTVKVTSFSKPGGQGGSSGAQSACGNSGSSGGQVAGGKKKNSKDAAGIYIGSILELTEKIETVDKNVDVNNLGESDFIIKYKPKTPFPRVREWMKTVFVSVVSFCGAAFAIMTFNNDANVSDVFANLYQIVMGTQSDGTTILELSYSVGLALGILVFFNHFASWKITVDPTPIEIEMRLYEENLNKALIQNSGRKESGVDVS